MQDLPSISECDVWREGDLLRIRHRGSGNTDVAETEEQAQAAGFKLRITAAWALQEPQI